MVDSGNSYVYGTVESTNCGRRRSVDRALNVFLREICGGSASFRRLSDGIRVTHLGCGVRSITCIRPPSRQDVTHFVGVSG